MNILIFNWRDPKNPKSGGAEIVTLEHAKAWVKRGHRVTWFSSKFTKSKGQETIDSINIVRRGNFLTTYLFAPFFYIFSGNKFDLIVDEVHGIPFFTPFYVRKPKLVFVHEVAGEIWNYMLPFPISTMGKFLEPLLYLPYKFIDFIAVSESTKKELINLGISTKKINVITNGLNVKPISSLPPKENVPTFIFVSRVVKMKGIEEVIKAFFHILKKVKDGQLWIVGDGDLRYLGYLKKTMNIYNVSTKVKFFGKVSNTSKLELMKKSHLLLHASVKEGWGLVVTEAASQGTPSVVYNVAGLRDSVRNGKTGIVVSQNNPQEMADQAIKLIEDKEGYILMQKQALEWAKSLTWERATKQSTDLLEKVAKNV